jgi:hypothetical protein
VIHKIKHDGYRLIVQRDGKRVRLFTRDPTFCRNESAFGTAHLL